MKDKKPPPHGLTLVEALVALVLLSVAGLVLMGLLPSVIIMGRGSQMQSVAITDAQILLENALRADQYTGNATYNIGVTAPPAPAPPLTVLPSGVATVTETADPNRPGVYDVTVAVTWTQEGGLSRSVQLSSAFAPPGLAQVPCPSPTQTPTTTPAKPPQSPTPTPSRQPTRSQSPTPTPSKRPPTPTPTPTPIQVRRPDAGRLSFTW